MHNIVSMIKEIEYDIATLGVSVPFELSKAMAEIRKYAESKIALGVGDFNLSQIAVLENEKRALDSKISEIEQERDLSIKAHAGDLDKILKSLDLQVPEDHEFDSQKLERIVNTTSQMRGMISELESDLEESDRTYMLLINQLCDLLNLDPEKSDSAEILKAVEGLKGSTIIPDFLEAKREILKLEGKLEKSHDTIAGLDDDMQKRDEKIADLQGEINHSESKIQGMIIAIKAFNL